MPRSNKVPFLPLAVGIVFSGCSLLTQPQQQRNASVFPSHTIFPTQQTIPRHLIDDLPQRIAALPVGRPLSITRLVELLGLTAYRHNVSANLRWNTLFMYLDRDHILYFSTAPDTLPDHTFLQTPWSAKVTVCSLRKNPDLTILSKQFAKR